MVTACPVRLANHTADRPLRHVGPWVSVYTLQPVCERTEPRDHGVKRALVVVAATLLTITRVLPISDPDYHWHLATGRWVLGHHAVPAVDPFSHTAFGAPWKFVDWLADVGMFLLHRSGGDTAVIVAFALLGGMALLFAAARAMALVPRASAWVTFGATVAAATVIAFRTTPRPQTASFMFFAAVLWLLDRARADRRALFALPPLLALWQNVHSSALLGVLAVFAYAIEALRDRRETRAWLAAMAASAFSLLCAVRPFDRLSAGFDHLGDPRVAELIPEWGTPFRSGVFGAWVVAALVLVALSATAVRRVTFGPLATAAGVTLLSLGSSRLLPLAAIAALPLALEALASLAERTREWFVALPAVVLAIAGFFLHVSRPGTGLVPGAFPERAVSFVREHGFEGNLFNDFHFGGYLIWTLGERSKVFVDGRSMALYGIEFVRDAVVATDANLVALLDKYDVSVVIVPPDRRMGALQRKLGWALVYFDDVAAVLVRESHGPEPLAYRALTPGNWFELARWRDPKRVELARPEVERALREAPDSSLVAAVAIAVALAGGDLGRADALLAEAERRFPHVQRIARARLVRCIEAEDRACACAAARTIMKDYPTNTYAAPVVSALSCP